MTQIVYEGFEAGNYSDWTELDSGSATYVVAYNDAPRFGIYDLKITNTGGVASYALLKRTITAQNIGYHKFFIKFIGAVPSGVKNLFDGLMTDDDYSKGSFVCLNESGGSLYWGIDSWEGGAETVTLAGEYREVVTGKYYCCELLRDYTHGLIQLWVDGELLVTHANTPYGQTTDIWAGMPYSSTNLTIELDELYINTEYLGPSWTPQGIQRLFKTTLDAYSDTNTLFNSSKRKMFYAKSWYWLLVSNDSDEKVYIKATKNFVDFIDSYEYPKKTVTGLQTAWAYSLNDDVLHLIVCDGGTGTLNYIGLQIKANGTASPINSDPIYPATDSVITINIAVDSEGYPWITYYDPTTYRCYVEKNTVKNGTAWNGTGNTLIYTDTLDPSLYGAMLIPLTDGKMYLLYNNRGLACINGALYDGSTWHDIEQITGSSCTKGDFDAVADTDDAIYMIFLNYVNSTQHGAIIYLQRTYTFDSTITIFSDGFETGAFSSDWTVFDSTGVNPPTVDSTIVHNGSYSAQHHYLAAVSGSGIYRNFAAIPIAHVRVPFYFTPAAGIVPNDGDFGTPLFLGTDATGTNGVNVVIQNSGGTAYWGLQEWIAGVPGAITLSTQQVYADDWTCVELKRDVTNEIAVLYINNKNVLEISITDTGDNANTQIGNIYWSWAAPDFWLYWDDVLLSTEYIGSGVESSWTEETTIRSSYGANPATITLDSRSRVNVLFTESIDEPVLNRFRLDDGIWTLISSQNLLKNIGAAGATTNIVFGNSNKADNAQAIGADNIFRCTFTLTERTTIKAIVVEDSASGNIQLKASIYNASDEPIPTTPSPETTVGADAFMSGKFKLVKVPIQETTLEAGTYALAIWTDGDTTIGYFSSGSVAQSDLKAEAYGGDWPNPYVADSSSNIERLMFAVDSLDGLFAPREVDSIHIEFSDSIVVMVKEDPYIYNDQETLSSRTVYLFVQSLPKASRKVTGCGL